MKMRKRDSISWVLQDIVALRKLNYIACIFADGEPGDVEICEQGKGDFDSRPRLEPMRRRCRSSSISDGLNDSELDRAIC